MPASWRRGFLAMGVLALACAACGRSPEQVGAAVDQPPPDISGIWGASLQGSLSDNPPFLPAALEAFNNLDSESDPIAICKPAGVPRVMNLNFGMEIVQTPQVVYFLMEYDQTLRRVVIGGTHPENPDPTWFGHSVGHWEGRTLVVDTVGFNDISWLDIRGHQHSDALHTIERFTLSEDGKNLGYEITIDDPKVYSKPWQATPKTFPRRPDLKLLEFICEV